MRKIKKEKEERHKERKERWRGERKKDKREIHGKEKKTTRSAQCMVSFKYTVRHFDADFAACDRRRYCKALCDVKFI